MKLTGRTLVVRHFRDDRDETVRCCNLLTAIESISAAMWSEGRFLDGQNQVSDYIEARWKAAEKERDGSHIDLGRLFT